MFVSEKLFALSLQDAKHQVEVLRAQKEEAVVSRQEVEAALRNARKEIEAQELVRDLIEPSCTRISL